MLRLHLGLRGAALEKRVLELFEQVEIPAAKTRLAAYPHEMSGGMNQRVMIAMAIACEPRLLIADEPTTALDVTIQAQVMELLRRLQRDRGMGMVLITHDLAVVAEMARRVCVMYAGQVVEDGLADDVFEHPRHPYTRPCWPRCPSTARRARGCRPCRASCRGATTGPWAACCRRAVPMCRTRCRQQRPALVEGVRCFFPLAP